MANYTILLIDYEPRSIERFRDPLTGAGYTVEIATDGVSGIEAFHRLSPDMVLVEAMIPKKHGFEVCQELKRTPHGRQTPVIITTGVYKGRKYRTQALHIYGCDEYIEKPIAAEQLLALVGKFFVAGSPGSSGSSGSSTRGVEAVSVTSERSTADNNADAIAKPEPLAETRGSVPAHAQPLSVAPMVHRDDTEDEIMARLDEILPGSRPTPPRAEPSPIAAGGSGDANLMAQMRAELDAELGAISGPLAFDVAPSLAPVAEDFPSDQGLSPSVLEALPAPDAQAPIAPVPAEIPVAKEEQPGQVVSFDTKRSRKHRKSEKRGKGSVPQPGRVAAPPKAAAPPTVDPTIRVEKVGVPHGSMVESEIESPAARRGKPLVLWLAVGAVALATVYLVYPRGESSGSNVEPAPRPTPTNAASAPPVAEPPPVASAPAEPVQQAPEPLPTIPEKPKPAPPAAADKQSAPKKSADRATATTRPGATAPASRKTAAPVPTAGSAPPTAKKPSTPGPAPSAPAVAEAAAIPASADETPQGLGTSAADAEAVPDSPPAPTTTKLVQPGQLIAIDEADTLPVPLTHRSPFYSTEAVTKRITGTVIMNVLINDHGTVDQVVLVTGVTGGDVNDAAIRAAKSWTYRPATKDGVPVKVWRSEKVVVKP
jgi:TonB family protein